jgi:capsular exopolysaccharide synthesis family protein
MQGPGMVIDLAVYYHMLREKAWVIITCVLVMAALGGAYVIRSPRIYEASAVVLVNQAEEKVVNIQQIASEDLSSAELLKTMEQNLTNRALLGRVVTTLKITPAQLRLPARSSALPPYSTDELAKALQDSVSARLVRGTRLITISAENEDPGLAQSIASAIVDQYIQSNREYHVGLATDANKFLFAQAEELKEKLEKSQQALQEYKEKNQAVSLEGSQNIIVEKLKDLNEKLTAAKGLRLKLESDYSQVQKLGGQPAEAFLNISSVADAQSVLDAQKEYIAEQAEIANLSQRYLPKHPKFIQAQGALRELKDALDRTIMSAADAVGTQYHAALDTENKLSDALKEQEQSALALNKMAIPYNVLQRQVDSDSALYNSVASRLGETDVTKNLDEDNIRLMEPPLLPDRPIKPRRTLIMAVALMAGLGLGVTICFALNLLDNSYKTVDQAEMQLELPAVAAVPKGKEGNSYEGGFVVINEPHGAIAESFRTLRTSLSLLGRESERKVFLFTSALPGEGKSFCSTNYAIALAHQGLRTLLIDADLRLPTLGQIFFKNAFHPGVSEVLTGNAKLGDACQASGVEGLDILTAGHRAPNPAELLAGSSFGDLVRDARLKYDRLVIDSAPVNAVSDSLLLLQYVQSVCLVIFAGKTPRKAVMRAVQRLTESGARPAGFVLNRLPQHGGANYYYHYSAGEYGKGVYGAPTAEA